MNSYLLILLSGIAVVIIGVIIFLCGRRAFRRRKMQEESEEETGTANSTNRRGRSNQRGAHEPYNIANERRRVDRNGFYFNFHQHNLRIHRSGEAAMGTGEESDAERPVVGADARRLRDAYQDEPYIGALVFDEPPRRSSTREPLYYGEAMYVSRAECAVPPTAKHHNAKTKPYV